MEKRAHPQVMSRTPQRRRHKKKLDQANFIELKQRLHPNQKYSFGGQIEYQNQIQNMQMLLWQI